MHCGGSTRDIEGQSDPASVFAPVHGAGNRLRSAYINELCDAIDLARELVALVAYSPDDDAEIGRIDHEFGQTALRAVRLLGQFRSSRDCAGEG